MSRVDMRLAEFAARLDRQFDVAKYVEPNGWDFAISAGEKGDLLRWASPQFARTFNGLLPMELAPDCDVRRVHLLVFPEESLVASVVAQERTRGAPGAVILTHHPVDMETGGRGFIAIPPAQLDALASANIAVYVLHAPLDCHREISTSRSVAEALDLTIEGTFAPYVAGDCGVIAVSDPIPFQHFVEQVMAVCEIASIPIEQIRYAGRPVSNIAIVAGGGDDTGYIAEAEALGCDTYLAGHWWTPHQGAWCDANRAAIRQVVGRSRMNFLSGSHDGTELVVFRDRLQPLLESWGLDSILIRQSDHWR